MRIKFDHNGDITIEALNSEIKTENFYDAAEKIKKITTGVIYLGPESILDKNQLDDFRLCYELGELMFSVIGGEGKDFDSARDLKFQLVKMSALSELRGNSCKK